MHTKNMDMVKKRISLILELMATFLSFQMTFSLVTAALVWAILDSTSGLDPSFDTIAPRYLKLRTVLSFLLSIVMSVLNLANVLQSMSPLLSHAPFFF